MGSEKHWGQKGGHYFAADTFKCMFLNENFSNLIQILLKLFLMKLTISYHLLSNGLAPDWGQAITLTNDARSLAHMLPGP